MLNIYIGELLPGKSHLPILFPHLGVINRASWLFIDFARTFPEKLFNLVQDPAQADYFLIPHDFFAISSNKSYVEGFETLAVTHHKPIIVFDYSDFDTQIQVSNSIIFRVATYRSKHAPNEILMPAAVQSPDPASVVFRSKQEVPIVGFCGFAGFRTWKERFKYYYKCMAISLKATLGIVSKAYMPGIYFRRKALRILNNVAGVKTSFVIRSSYSGHADTIEVSPEQARAEYIENIINSDFALAPKGDGNYSRRFYEILSHGRIPVLIDTECVLPLESDISYEDIIIRIPYTELETLPNVIAEKYDSLTSQSFIEMQRKALDVFNTQLRADIFFRRMFTEPGYLDRYNSWKK